MDFRDDWAQEGVTGILDLSFWVFDELQLDLCQGYRLLGLLLHLPDRLMWKGFKRH